jgi:hypothetical protein
MKVTLVQWTPGRVPLRLEGRKNVARGHPGRIGPTGSVELTETANTQE